jgi:hypothetical protein
MGGGGGEQLPYVICYFTYGISGGGWKGGGGG